MGEVVHSDVLAGWRAYKEKQRERLRPKFQVDYTRFLVADHLHWEWNGPLESWNSDAVFFILTGKETESIFLQF
jgi:hypothetical protein